MGRVDVVEVAGEFSLRGGILDVFPPDRSEPVRVEFFGDEVESIRPFDPETQRSLGTLEQVALTTPSAASDGSPDALGHVADYLPEGAWVALLEPDDLKEQGGHYLARVEDRRGLYPVEATFRRLTERPSIALSSVAASTLETTCRLRVESVERFSGELNKVKAELDAASDGHRVLIACHNEAECERLGDVFADSELAQVRPTGADARPGPLGVPAGRRGGPRHRRPRALRPDRGPPLDRPPPLREPGDRQLPRPQRGRPRRPRQPRDRPLPRASSSPTSRRASATPRSSSSSNSPRGPGFMCRSPRSTSSRSTSAAARSTRRSRRSARRPGSGRRRGSPRPSSTWRRT